MSQLSFECSVPFGGEYSFEIMLTDDEVSLCACSYIMYGTVD